MVTQVPQGQINPQPVVMNNQTPKYRSKTQGGKAPQNQQRPGKAKA